MALHSLVVYLGLTVQPVDQFPRFPSLFGFRAASEIDLMGQLTGKRPKICAQTVQRLKFCILIGS